MVILLTSVSGGHLQEQLLGGAVVEQEEGEETADGSEVEGDKTSDWDTATGFLIKSIKEIDSQT
eukprot:CAMPEP_0117865158 /NCGR_PEP_ID=MMETSP0950-20121206/6568_1 /TAXON_ID=44440 /ORGANISM="Chattonella subsalsa, Strain CCMP2191" /LENGTH=63 /DNA_ID=CAMNT_0005716181 /DNA_START=95 /DNA_END=284 /DNA_ORIENTATION=+